MIYRYLSPVLPQVTNRLAARARGSFGERRNEVLTAYIQRALDGAHYEIIKDEEPYYGAVPELAGVWATGSTLEACRRNLADAIEDWLLFSLAKGLSIPDLDDLSIQIPKELAF